MKVVLTLLPTVSIVFAGFLSIGLAMPVLPLYVHHELGLSMFAVGLVAGATFAASLVSRFFAGNQADARGAKSTIVTGLLLASVSGVFYCMSLRFAGSPQASVALLLIGRMLLGAADSFVVAAGLGWGLALVGAQHAGKVMAWVGTAIYFAYAIGAPVGGVLYARYGFAAIAVATTLVPLAAVLSAAPLGTVPAKPRTRPAFAEVLDAVKLPGFGLALSGIGFGAITTFIPLYVASRGWGGAWMAFTTLSAAFVLGRLVFGNLPDRIGGARVAVACVLVEVVGQVIIWSAPDAGIMQAGVALTGVAYALAYPAFGVEAVRRAPPQSRGLVMATYTACLDLALGLGNPLLGVIAGRAALRSVFLTSALAALCAAAVALWLLSRNPQPRALTARAARPSSSLS